LAFNGHNGRFLCTWLGGCLCSSCGGEVQYGPAGEKFHWILACAGCGLLCDCAAGEDGVFTAFQKMALKLERASLELVKPFMIIVLGKLGHIIYLVLDAFAGQGY